MVDSFRELVKARVGDFTKLLGGGYVVPTHYEARHKRLLAQLVTSICNIFDIIGLTPRKDLWVMRRGRRQPWHVDDYDLKGGISVLFWLGDRTFHWVDAQGKAKKRTAKAGDVSVLVGPVYHRGGNTADEGEGIICFVFFDTNPVYMTGTDQQGFKETAMHPMVNNVSAVPSEITEQFKHICACPSLLHVVGHLCMVSHGHAFPPLA